MAGGALSVTAASAFSALQFAVGQRSGTKEAIALALLVALCAYFIWDIPAIPANRPLRAQSIRELFWAMVQIGSWPLAPSIPTRMSLLAVAIIHAPAILFSLSVVTQRPPLADRRWFVVALIGWSILNVAATAYGRGQYSMAPRYFDLFSMLLVLNGACLLYFVTIAWGSPHRRSIAFGLAAVWLLLLMPGAVGRFQHGAGPLRHTVGQRQRRIIVLIKRISHTKRERAGMSCFAPG